MTELTTRDDFNPVHVIALIQDGSLSRKDALRILKEACHLIVKLRDQQEQIEQWEKAAPWRQE